MLAVQWPCEQQNQVFIPCGHSGMCLYMSYLRKMCYRKKCDAGSNALLGILVPGIHLDVILACTTYLNLGTF